MPGGDPRGSVVRRRAACSLALCAVALGLGSASPASGVPHPPLSGPGACVTNECHPRLVGSAVAGRGGSIHPPAGEGACGSCHDLALPARGQFVRAAPEAGGRGPGATQSWDVALCTGCHGEGLLAPSAGAATGFADGKRNLHALHVQSGRARRCLPCHDPHAARQPKLLRERIAAHGTAVIAQEFRADAAGGWCRTGCHAPKSYRR